MTELHAAGADTDLVKESNATGKNPHAAAARAGPRARRNRKAGVAYAVGLGAAFIALLCLNRWATAGDAADGLALSARRELSNAGDCDGVEGGGLEVFLYAIAILYIFIGVAICCDDWFVDSLEHLSDVFGLSDDVAGATFMAAGSSAPELFTSFADTFGPSNNIGIGTIVGSAMFNILVIVALSGAVVPGGFALDWRPIVRDVAFYSIAIAEMAAFFMPLEGEVDEAGNQHGRVYFYEATILTVTYFLYILFMVFNKRIFSTCPLAPQAGSAIIDTESPAGESPAEGTGLLPNNPGAERKSARVRLTRGTMESLVTREAASEVFDEDEDEFKLWKMPTSGICSPEGVAWCLMWPYYAIFTLTIPKCNLKITFVLSIIWIGVLCWFMVEFATKIGCILSIPPAVMGITVLAIGTSVPDALGSIIEAKQGKADMAVANAVGSNIFDILLGLGLPWMCYTFVHANDPVEKYITVDVEGITLEIIILYATVLAYTVALRSNGWKMNQGIGRIFLVLYLMYFVWVVIEQGFHS